MKRIIFLLLALTVLSFAAFAQDKGPEVTYGFSGSFEMDVFKSSKTDTYESGDFNVPIAKADPIGLQATNFVLSPNVALDWDKMSIAADATYDGWRQDDDDWSSVNITTIWKDFYGFELKSEVSADNEDSTPDSTTPDAVEIGELGHDFTITLDRLEDMGIKMWTKYDASLFDDFGAADIGYFMQALLDDFDELGFEVDTEGLGAELVYEEDPAGDGVSDFSTAWIEARNMFGMWTMLVNDGDAMELRLADLDTSVTIDREQFGIGEDNDILDIAEGTDVNVKHTLSLTDAMTLTIGTIVPYNEVTWVNWIRDENLVANLEMGLDGIGTIGVGTLIAKDYVAMGDPVNFVEGPTGLIAAPYATDTAVTDTGSAVWVDANLSELVDGIDLFASMDIQFNKYVDIADAVENQGAAAADDPYVISPVGYQLMHIGAEAGMSVTEDLKVMAAFMAGLGMGLDHEKLYGLAYEEGESTNYVDNDAVAGEWSEKDQLATVYGVNSLILDIRAEFALNDTVGLWAQDTLTMNEGYLNDAAADYYVAAADFGTAGLAGYGYFHKNTLEVGADLTASENADITLSAAYDMFLGLPSASDFYPDGAADAEKEAIDYDYDGWKDDNFAPLSVSVAFSFSY